MIYIEPATSARYEFCGIEGLPVLGVGEVVKLVSSKDDLTTAGPLDAVCQWEVDVGSILTCLKYVFRDLTRSTVAESQN